MSSPLLGPVSLFGRGCCLVVSLGQVHCRVRLIVRAGFIVAPRSLLVLVYC